MIAGPDLDARPGPVTWPCIESRTASGTKTARSCVLPSRSLLSIWCFGWKILNGLDLLHNPSRGSDGDGEVGNVLRDDASCSNCAAFADLDVGHNGHVSSNPAVVTNGH